MNTRCFHGETFKGQKPPKALVIHPLNEMTEFFNPKILRWMFFNNLSNPNKLNNLSNPSQL